MTASKKTPENIQLLTDQLEIGMTRTDATAIVGIHFDTFCEWMKDPEFSDVVKKAEAKCRQRCIGIIQKSAITSWQAAAWWLERKHPEEYAQRSRHEVTGPNGGPIPIAASKRIDLSGLTTEQVEKLYQALVAPIPAPQLPAPTEPEAPPAESTEASDGQP